MEWGIDAPREDQPEPFVPDALVWDGEPSVLPPHPVACCVRAGE